MGLTLVLGGVTIKYSIDTKGKDDSVSPEGAQTLVWCDIFVLQPLFVQEGRVDVARLASALVRPRSTVDVLCHPYTTNARHGTTSWRLCVHKCSAHI